MNRIRKITISFSLALSLLLLIASGVVFRYFLLPYHEFEDSEERDRRFWVCRAKIKEYDEEFVDEAHRAEAYRFCRDNELVKAAASLGLFSSALHFLVACLIFKRRHRGVVAALCVVTLSSFSCVVLPLCMRNDPKEDSQGLCNDAADMELNYPKKYNHSQLGGYFHDEDAKPFYGATNHHNHFHGGYVCFPGGIHNFHILYKVRKKLAGSAKSFTGTLMFLVCTIISTLTSPPAAYFTYRFFIKGSEKEAKVAPAPPTPPAELDVETGSEKSENRTEDGFEA